MRLLLPETDQLPVLAAPVRAGSSAQIYRLQQIRLTLGIVPEKNIDAGRKCDIRRIIISVIIQLYGFHKHDISSCIP